MTQAIFNLSGTTPVDIEQLNITSSGLDISGPIILRSLVGIEDGPLALDNLRSHISFSISNCVTGARKKLEDREDFK